MKAFEYASPTGVDQAVRALAGAESGEALAGGTDLLCRMKDYISNPERVVDLRHLEDDTFRAIAEDRNNGLVLGGGTRLVDLVKHETIQARYPAITQAARSIGTPQIRNMATLGGNLLQRPRCWYYRAGFGLLGGKRESESLVRQLEGEYAPYNIDEPEPVHLVRAGDNRYHAIFMTDGDALYVNPSSLAPALIALGAEAEIVGPEGKRTVAVRDLYTIPRTEEDRELTLSPDEVLARVLLPKPAGRNATYEIRQKQSHDWPLVLASVALAMNGETVQSASIVLGAVAPIPYQAKAAEAAITGKPLNAETAAAAGKAATEGAKPLSKNGYKVNLAQVAVRRALLRAAGEKV